MGNILTKNIHELCIYNTVYLKSDGLISSHYVALLVQLCVSVSMSF